MPSRNKPWRGQSVLCGPLWPLSSPFLQLPDFSAGDSSTFREKVKQPRSCPPHARSYRSCLSLACALQPESLAWNSCQETWSLWSFFTGEEESPDVVYLRFENQTDATVAVYWFSNEGELQLFYKLNAGCSITQETFYGNVWMIKEDSVAQTLLKRVKVDEKGNNRQVCYITTLPQGKTADPTVDDFPGPDIRIPSCYTRILETALGIPIVATSDVCMAALHASGDIIRNMLQGCPAYVIRELCKHRCKVAIIGRNKVTTDILEHSHLRGSPTPDGRDWDTEVRGLGGTLVIPTCTVGEENVLRCPKDRYGKESILVHEFGHTVMEIALGPKCQKRILDCYLRNKDRYKPGIYMIADEKEYWAEGTQSWFNASLRHDVNGGICTRDKLWAHDPELASLLREVYGNTAWRYDFSPVEEM